MDSPQAEQCARIIEDIFQYEEQIDPRTVVLMFKKMATLYRKFEGLNSKEEE